MGAPTASHSFDRVRRGAALPTSSLGRGAQLALVAATLLGTAGCPGETSCDVDSECGGGEVCARTHECLREAQVWRVQVRWTVRGEVANAATCGPVEPLGIHFESTRDDVLTFEPLVCTAGLFTVDKLPTRMKQVRISGSASAAAGIPLSGQVQIDLR